ncbi:unnamed protein product (mitochondrion) [Plasmodiophora brassicae]|uniref:Uncharacterized protein n=1 Tax=Plasmodiophora brassicae TaxID=37360 RepID=A0A0G4J1B5_PLABS|nr:hypothetical protein PBRA_001908 [Plasmodiophora brassicae]SPR01336.1 unnamed protein product [Plasmodiophora brassicae]
MRPCCSALLLTAHAGLLQAIAAALEVGTGDHALTVNSPAFLRNDADQFDVEGCLTVGVCLSRACDCVMFVVPDADVVASILRYMRSCSNAKCAGIVVQGPPSLGRLSTFFHAMARGTRTPDVPVVEVSARDGMRIRDHLQAHPGDYAKIRSDDRNAVRLMYRSLGYRVYCSALCIGNLFLLISMVRWMWRIARGPRYRHGDGTDVWIIVCLMLSATTQVANWLANAVSHRVPAVAFIVSFSALPSVTMIWILLAAVLLAVTTTRVANRLCGSDPTWLCSTMALVVMLTILVVVNWAMVMIPLLRSRPYERSIAVGNAIVAFAMVCASLTLLLRARFIRKTLMTTVNIMAVRWTDELVCDRRLQINLVLASGIVLLLQSFMDVYRFAFCFQIELIPHLDYFNEVTEIMAGACYLVVIASMSLAVIEPVARVADDKAADEGDAWQWNHIQTDAFLFRHGSVDRPSTGNMSEQVVRLLDRFRLFRRLPPRLIQLSSF